ncbi:hypothetical protein [Nocardia sp. SSK8]|uniref:hypothetical protein n=1 Tax=Nocardia sp. SSK8 TaxID=3120154 RepID=UPI00300B538D
MIGKFETNKDLVQELTSSGARRVGNIAALITGTVAEVAREIGEFVTDAIEMNEAAAAARRDAAVERAEQRREAAEDLGTSDETEYEATAWLTEPEPEKTQPAPGEPGKA